MKKIYLLLSTILAFTIGGVAQPTVLGTQLGNGSYVTYDLNSIGLFKQYRLQATSSAAISTRNWEFASGTAGATNYAINWRPYTSGNTLSPNLFIPTSFANGAKYNTAFGGASGLLPVIISGNYYTFNVNINAASDNQMELLETSYNPVTITSVSNTIPANASNAVLITCTTSAAPSSGENVYVRYSIDGYATSALSQFVFTGSTGKALIPCQAAGTVVSYYVMSSNQTAAQITSDVATYGQSANDMATLNLNNGGSNYTYTQGNGTNFGGIYSTPSTCYANVSAFVTALNAGTVTAPVTCYAIGGSPTETAPPAGGISITQTGTAANPIIFQKFGSGNYTVQASAALTVGSLTDAIFKLVGADYITIDGFTMQENAANVISATGATNNMTEFGVVLFHASTTDGAQNNTIQNNTISLNKTYLNTFGVYSNTRHSATSITVANDPTNATTGPNSGNKIYGNTISNVNMGIAFIGANVSANEDVGNDIGGSAAATGNTITNWGGAAALSGYLANSGTSYCILSNNETNDNISYNTITSAPVSGVAVTFCGIRKDYTASQPVGTVTSNITNNTVTMSSGFTSGTFDAILNQGLAALATATININNNSIINNVISGAASSSTFIGIANSSIPGILNMNNNIIRGTTTTATTGGFVGIQNTGAVVTTVNITGNQVGSSSTNAVTFSAATTSQIIAINNTGGAATTTVNITNNSIQGISGVSTVGNTYGITNSSSAGVAMNITGNTIGSASRDFVTFSAASTGVFGILNSSSASTTNLTVTNNTVDRISGVSFSGTLAGIANTAAAIGGAINLSNNAVGTTTGTFITTTASSAGTLYAIWNNNGASTATLTMNNNTVDGFYIFSTTVNLTTMASNGANLASVNMNSNIFGSTGTLINLSGAQPSTGTLRVMDIGAGSSNATCTVMCQNNTIRGINYAVTGAGTVTCIFINSSPLSATIQGNQFNNLSLNTTDNVWMVLDIATRLSGQTLTINNNSIVTGLAKTAGSGYVAGETSAFGAPVNGSTLNITNNNFSNISVTGNTNVYGVRPTTGVSAINGPTLNITGNTINNITAASGTVWGIYLDLAAAATIATNSISAISSNSLIYGIDIETNNGQGIFDINSNTINNLASTGTSGHVRGIFLNSAGVPTFNIYSNTITNLSSAGLSNIVSGVMLNSGQAANIYDNTINNLTNAGTLVPVLAGLNIISGTTLNIYRNKIHSLTASGVFTATATTVYGMRFTAGTTVNVYNNFVANLSALNIDHNDGIHGIDISSSVPGSNYNLYYNSIEFLASSTGTNFGSSGIYHLTNATSTTAALTMIDNIIDNRSGVKGTGITVAYRRSDATLANYGTSSDYNLFYAGTQSATNVLYYDGTNSDQGLSTYQVRMNPRDANSITGIPTYASATDLHLTSANCFIDGAGTPVGSVTADIDAQSRDAATPDIGADEFTATLGTGLAVSLGTATCSNKTVSPSGTTYTALGCNLIARVLPSGVSAVAGKINVCVVTDLIQMFHNAEPYVQRHFDIEPTTSNTTTTSATITLYFTDGEFGAFNTNNPAWPRLPTVAFGGNADAVGISHLRVTQYHGTANTNPSTPGNYSAGSNGIYINPADANIVWNGFYWAVTIDVTGFSGFYVHTNPLYPLPVSFNYLDGVKQGNKHLLSWSVSCNTTPRVTLTLERSADARSFNSIYSITADAARCGQPFDYTDAQPLTGMNYYRLKIVDADGKITYSNIIALINGTKGFALLNIAPNPVTGNSFKLNTTSASSAKMELVISDMQGRIVNRQTILLSAGFNSSDINVSDLAPGTYNIYGMTADDKSGLIRFVKR